MDPQVLKAFALLYVQLLVVTSVALFFSTFSGPMLSAPFTFGLLLVGHFQHGPGALRERREVAGGGLAGQGALLHPAQPGADST